jgi:flagellar biosynthesis protein FlhF
MRNKKMDNAMVYRATTLREALEKIKFEMGEDALVLAHRQIRVGGLFGFGKREMVEVRVAPGNRQLSKAVKELQRESARTDWTRTETKPQTQAQPPRAFSASLAAFAARAYAGIKRTPTAAKADQSPADKNRTENTRIEPEQREMWREAETVRRTPATSTYTSAAPASGSYELAGARESVSPNVGGELQRLRAEMRELKFTLASLNRATLQNREFDFLTDAEDSEEYRELLDIGLHNDMVRQAVEIANQFPQADRQDALRVGLGRVLQNSLRFSEEMLSVPPGTMGAPAATVFIGPTGVGKTTTVAKLAANIFLKSKQRVELITLDTYRIAAAEQLKTYAEIIGVGCHTARSVSDLDDYVKQFAGKAVVLIDTAGRNPNDLADQLELANYLRNASDVMKCLVLQATTNHIDAQITARKFGYFAPDQLVITKFDETTRPGAAISVAAGTGLPLAYICAGQRVPEDIERASAAALAEQIMRATLFATAA